MKSLSLDEIRTLLPDVEELRPLMDRLLREAAPDDGRRWAASGELGTLGQRLVEPGALETAIPAALDDVRRHLSRVYESVASAIQALARSDPEGALEALLAAAATEREAGRTPEAEAFLAAALDLGPRLEDGRILAPALVAGARIARSLGRWELAESRYRRAASIARDAGDPELTATAAIGAGNLAVDRGRWTLARRRYDEAEAHLASLPAGAPEHWHLALNRSIVAREEGRLDEADTFLGRAEEAADGDGSGADALAIIQNQRGQILRDRGRHEEAELAFRAALAQATGVDARVAIGVNLADALVRLGSTLEAGEVARRAEEIALSKGVVARLPDVYRVLGDVASSRGHADAFVFFERALAVVREHRLPEIERARALEAYGRHDRGRGEEEVGRARLREAAEIYETLGHETALQRVRATMDAEERRDAPGGETHDG